MEMDNFYIIKKRLEKYKNYKKFKIELNEENINNIDKICFEVIKMFINGISPLAYILNRDNLTVAKSEILIKIIMDTVRDLNNKDFDMGQKRSLCAYLMYKLELHCEFNLKKDFYKYMMKNIKLFIMKREKFVFKNIKIGTYRNYKYFFEKMGGMCCGYIIIDKKIFKNLRLDYCENYTRYDAGQITYIEKPRLKELKHNEMIFGFDLDWGCSQDDIRVTGELVGDWIDYIVEKSD